MKSAILVGPIAPGKSRPYRPYKQPSGPDGRLVAGVEVYEPRGNFSFKSEGGSGRANKNNKPNES
jgi:hypothetical protein